jgi:uncharacterized protein YydD (DUF2326 family)
VLDFGFLSTRDARFFLFRHLTPFSEFVFYLEIQLMDASYVTVRRSVEEASKVSFKKHEASRQDFTTLPDADWDHVQLPFERSREMLDSLLDWRALKPWSYRKGIGYLLRRRRTSETFSIFPSLRQHNQTGSHFWRICLASMLDLIASHYAKEVNYRKSRQLPKR